MVLKTKMSNRQLIQHFIAGNTRPGETVHEFTTLSSIPKHSREMMEQNKVLKRALSNIHGYTYIHPAREAAKEIMKDGYLHHAKSKHGTASSFVDHIFTEENKNQENVQHQNIRNIQKQREAEERGKNALLFDRDDTHSKTSTPSTSAPLLHTRNVHGLLCDAESDAQQAESAIERFGRPLSPADYGVAETNLKPISELPKQITKPTEWIKAEEEIEEPAID